jgi:predicted nucleic acid-binding Zn ribbon protein
VASCIQCGAPLPPKNTKLCSKRCHALAQIKPHIACANDKCGKMFHPPKSDSRYCSKACANTAMKTRHSDELKERLMELRQTGMKYADIGKILGIPKNAVCGLCRRAGLPSLRGRPRSRPPGAKTHKALARYKPDELPPNLLNVLHERLVVGAEPLPPMHPISWGAIAL